MLAIRFDQRPSGSCILIHSLPWIGSSIFFLSYTGKEVNKLQTKKQYVKPTLKEHGVVRELTQKSGSGGRRLNKPLLPPGPRIEKR